MGRCEKLDISISLNTWSQDTDADQAEFTRRDTIHNAIIHSLKYAQAPHLKCLVLKISYETSSVTAVSMLSSLATFLGTAIALQELLLSIRTVSSEVEEEKPLDLFKDLKSVMLPNLERLTLSGASVDPMNFERFLTNQKKSLKQLALYDVSIINTTACWSTLLKRLPNILSLSVLDASCLSDEGDPSTKFTKFIGPHSADLPKLQQYICHRGPWYPLRSSVTESAYQNMDKMNDSRDKWNWSWWGHDDN
jgi:hypothetical protein